MANVEAKIETPVVEAAADLARVPESDAPSHASDADIALAERVEVLEAEFARVDRLEAQLAILAQHLQNSSLDEALAEVV